jgi:hypothetical protein
LIDYGVDDNFYWIIMKKVRRGKREEARKPWGGGKGKRGAERLGEYPGAQGESRGDRQERGSDTQE